jgi:REP element-mobilizing transposase RayT
MYELGHGDESLRRRRISVLGATYFLTLCLKNRTEGLNKIPVVDNVQKKSAA